MEAHSFAQSDGGLTLPRSRKLLSAFGDDRLVAQLRRGNAAAFEVLYDRHHAAVLSYCRHMLGSRDEAEDALQQAFVSAHADIMASDKPIRFKAWLYTIARNRCLSILRARRERPSDDLERISTAGLSDEVQQRAELQELLADMRELPEDQRTALILSELGDLSHADVAGVIDCEVAKVKSLVFQARSGLIERRQARETPCEEIREQLATLRGGSLRRGPLRRHVKACPGCSEFRDEVRRQRQMVVAILPVVPTLGLRENALAAAGVGASSAGIGALVGGGTGAAFVAKAGLAKVAVIAITTSGAVGGAVAVQQTTGGGDSRSGQQGDEAAPAGASGVAGSTDDAGAGVGAIGDVDANARDRSGDAGTVHDGSAEKRQDAASGLAGEDERGFEPGQDGSNGERGRAFGRSRDGGHHRGLDKEVARGGANRGVRRDSKPKKNRGSRRPETAGPKNEARPAPKPTPLVPLVPPELAPPPGSTREPGSSRVAPEEDDGDDGDDGATLET